MGRKDVLLAEVERIQLFSGVYKFLVKLRSLPKEVLHPSKATAKISLMVSVMEQIENRSSSP
ncbi:MAG: hypothetical protein SFY66_15780 [Oculatellaceae cyanobacterium bins.114]|nr:hypothetical protein [Oculatellaceae cyanobacterium bins.114]